MIYKTSKEKFKRSTSSSAHWKIIHSSLKKEEKQFDLKFLTLSYFLFLFKLIDEFSAY